jgi:hypothetical protein
MPQKVTHAFSKKAFQNTTPSWARYMFGITFILTSAFTLFLAGTNLFSEDVKYELMLAGKALDAVIYGLSKMFGIEIREEQ